MHRLQSSRTHPGKRTVEVTFKSHHAAPSMKTRVKTTANQSWMLHGQRQLIHAIQTGKIRRLGLKLEFLSVINSPEMILNHNR